MSVHDDYAGGSYKSNGELETDIETLQTQLSAAQDKIIELESSLDKLKNSINKMVAGNIDHEEPYTPREIVQLLFSWANGG